MPNRLAQETSPYLLQHASNPVDWFPWGEEAITRAKDEQKPVFLSIGYSACHWCHVMEHESFEDNAIAQKLNKHFVSIKVDREERPDLDQIYMNAVQLLTGRGGWPMSVFLTPDLQPFLGGTYWPPRRKMGMPGFDEVLDAVIEVWEDRRDQATNQAAQLASHLGELALPAGTKSELELELLHGAERGLERSFDRTHGGFGGAPKFPHAMDVMLLLRTYYRDAREATLDIVTTTLDRMAAGGIYDHVGGGFHRYSVDERWLVPHFEKMLYDNALLSQCYVEAYQVTQKKSYAEAARGIYEYILRDMTDPDGGFYSTEDADSEGEEGKFYVWTPDEIADVLDSSTAERFCYVYDISPEGNFEGKSILNLPKPIEQVAMIKGWNESELRSEMAEAREKLFHHREQRVHPGRDDKILVSWNGLMIDSLAKAAGALSEPRYSEAAIKAADFILQNMRKKNGRLLHSYRNSRARFDAYLDDYACFSNALVSVYELTQDGHWIDEAVSLAKIMLRFFQDRQQGGFFFTASDHEQLIARSKDIQDSSTPSASAMATMALLRLARLTGRNEFEQAAVDTLVSAAALMKQAPTAAGQMLMALDFHLGPTNELVLLVPQGDEFSHILPHVQSRLIPRAVIVARTVPSSAEQHGDALADLFANKELVNGEATLFACERFSCQEPIHGESAIMSAIDSMSSRRSS